MDKITEFTTAVDNCECPCTGPYCNEFKETFLDGMGKGKETCDAATSKAYCPNMNYIEDSDYFTFFCPDDIMSCPTKYGKAFQCHEDTNSCLIPFDLIKPFFDAVYPNRREGQEAFTLEQRKENFDMIVHTYSNYAPAHDPYRPDEEESPVGAFFYDYGMSIGLFFTSFWTLMFPSEENSEYVSYYDYYSIPE